MRKDEALAVARQWLFGYDTNLDAIEPPYANHHFDEIDPDDYFIFAYGSKCNSPAAENTPLVGIKKDSGRIKYLGRNAVEMVSI